MLGFVKVRLVREAHALVEAAGKVYQVLWHFKRLPLSLFATLRLVRKAKVLDVRDVDERDRGEVVHRLEVAPVGEVLRRAAPVGREPSEAVRRVVLQPFDAELEEVRADGGGLDPSLRALVGVLVRQLRDVGMAPVHRHAFLAGGDARVDLRRDLLRPGPGKLLLEVHGAPVAKLLLAEVPAAERYADRAAPRVAEVQLVRQRV